MVVINKLLFINVLLVGLWQREVLWFGSGMSPQKPLCVEGLVPSLRHYWGVVEPLGGGAKWQEVRSLGMCSSIKMGPQPLPDAPSFSLSLFSSHYEVSSSGLPHTPAMMCCLTTGQK